MRRGQQPGVMEENLFGTNKRMTNNEYENNANYRAREDAIETSHMKATASYPDMPRVSSFDRSTAAYLKIDGKNAVKIPRAFKVIFSVWFVFSIVVLMSIVDDLEDEQSRLVSVYFSAPSLIAIAMWLWGLNVYLWHEKMKLQPSPLVVFSEKHTKSFANEDAIPHALDSEAVFGIAAIFSVATTTGAACFSKALKDENEFAASFYIFFFYILAPAIIFFAPTKNGFLFGMARKALITTISRICAPTAQAISFTDFFAADVLCSFAKSLSDVERVFCSAFQGHILSHAAEGACGDQSWRIPFVLCIPSAIRLIQCIRQRRDTNDELCFWNAVKYFSAFPVIWCSALKYHVDEDDWERYYRPMWFAFAVINSSFSYYWDLTHDWDLPMVKNVVSQCAVGRREVVVASSPSNKEYDVDGDDFSNNNNNNNNNNNSKIENSSSSSSSSSSLTPYGLRNNRLYKAPAVYYFACATNLMLRVSWTYKLAAHLRKNSRTVFFVSALEIVRRFQWSIFRIEKAYLKAKRASSFESLLSNKV